MKKLIKEIKISKDRVDLIHAKTKEVVDELSQHGYAPFELNVKIERIKPTFAGLAYRVYNIVILNSLYVRDHFEDALNVTLAHEICHLYQHKYYPRAKQAHGPEWKNLMRLLNLAPNTYHKLSVPELENNKKRKARYIYSDGNKSFKLTTAKHNKIQKLRLQVSCNGKILVWTGEAEYFY